MRHFSYFLFENFDVDSHADDPLNPRRFLNAGTDIVLSYISDIPAGSCSTVICKELFGNDIINALTVGGIIRTENDRIYFDTPVFLREDAVQLRTETECIAKKLVNALEASLPIIRDLCANVSNSFSIEINLYHILCAMIFDGSFFNYLETNNAVATSRPHQSGLDYLSVIYEKCGDLNGFSDRLLCSYNRFAGSGCALQSFGDANGNRLDLYRFFRLLESGKLPRQFQRAHRLYIDCGNATKETILHHVSNLIEYGSCPPPVMALLEHFEYAKDNVISVPVYKKEDIQIIDAISAIVEKSIGELFVSELTALSKGISIIANSHGVNHKEIANEIYHILFGSVNEELVRRGIVADPQYNPGEGRYFKSIQLF